MIFRRRKKQPKGEQFELDVPSLLLGQIYHDAIITGTKVIITVNPSDVRCVRKDLEEMGWEWMITLKSSEILPQGFAYCTREPDPGH